MVMITRWLPNGCPTVARQLHDSCEPHHPIRYILNYKIYNNISFHWHTFIKRHI
jgi:hypothetical protein